MSNFYSPITTDTLFRPEDINPILATLDRIISFQRSTILHCDGNISYEPSTGNLTWSDTLRILFNNDSGNLIENTLNAGFISLLGNQMAYVDLNTTNGSVITPSVASLTTGTASNTLTYNRLVLGYRNSSDSSFYPVAIRLSLNAVGDMTKNIYDTTDSGIVDQAEAVEWEGILNIPDNLTYLSDLILSGNAGKLVVVNSEGTGLELIDSSSGGASLASLSDATITTPTNSQVLTYNSTTSKWENATHSSGGVSSAVTLSAASWSSSTYTISNANITASSIITLAPSSSMTSTQYDAIATAKIVESSISTGQVVLKALGTVPTVDCPVVLIIEVIS